AHSQVEIMRYLGMQSLTSALAGNQPGPGASIIKLFWSEYHKKVTELALDILGPEAMMPSGEVGGSSIQAFAGGEMSSAQAVRSFLGARPGTIYAGTSQVQRNII